MKFAPLTSFLMALAVVAAVTPIPAAAQTSPFYEAQYTYRTGYIASGRQPSDGCDKAKEGATRKAKNAGYPKLVGWVRLGVVSDCKVARSRPGLLGLPGRSFTFTAKGEFRQQDIVDPKPRCHPNYKNDQGVCVPNVEWPKYDVNCKGSAVYAPYYTDKKKKFKYHPGPDIFNLDRDKDRWACEVPSPGTVGQ